jgi:hypothetical protein
MDVAKVDRDVSYVAMVVHLCCKSLSLMFHLSFSDVYCKCVFIWRLHMLHAYVANVLSGCCVHVAKIFKCFCVFLYVPDACFKCFICLQTYVVNFHLDVSKVDRMLYILQWHRSLADNGLPHGFGSYLVRSASPSPLSPLPFLPSISLR